MKKWIQKFRNGNFDLENGKRAGRPEIYKDEDLEHLLDEDSCQTQSELATTLGGTQQDISSHLKKLGKIQKEGRGNPHVLSESNKTRRCDTALSLLSHFKTKNFLHKIMTGDEKWVLYDNPKTRKSEPSTSTAKSNIHVKKFLPCICWDFKAVMYFELLKPGETITAEHYKH